MQENWKKVIELAEKNYIKEAIAKEVNLSESQIGRILRKFNLKVTRKDAPLRQTELIEGVARLLKEKLTIEEIAEKLGSSKSKVSRIAKNILNLHSWRDTIEFTDRQKSILVGGILGDSYLSKADTSTVNSSLIFAHCIKQKDYFLWKYEELNIFNKYIIMDRLTKGKYNTEIRTGSVRLKALSYYRNLFYPNGIKTITEENIQLLDELGLAVHFMDDGGKADTTYQLCTQSFTLEGCQIIQKYLLDKWNIETTLNAKRVMRIRMKSRNLFTSIILPYIVPCMLYKIYQ